MNGYVGNLSTKQEKALNQFRENVQDIFEKRPDCNDDGYLLRWLRARCFDLKRSEAMLREHISWRELNNIDAILRDYEPPLVMRKFYVGGLCGHDKEGSLIWIDPVGHLDIKGILRSMKKQDVVKSKVWLLEDIYRRLKEKSLKEGRRVDQISVIMDLEKFGMRHLWKPGVDVLTEIVALFEKHYPETLKKAYVINAPRIFPIAYSLMRPFLSEDTHRKVAVLGSNYEDILLQDIDADQLPAHWGGSSVDPDGNPRCPSKVVPGGDVPTSYYYDVNNLDDISSFTQTSINRGSSLQLDFTIEKPLSAIRWQFKTDGSDIGFGVFLRKSDQRQKAGDMEPILMSQRVNSHMVPEDGSVQCKNPGTYVLRFDNTYSWVKAKKLFYLIEILEPKMDDLDLPESPSSNSLSPEANSSSSVWTSFPCNGTETEPELEQDMSAS